MEEKSEGGKKAGCLGVESLPNGLKERFRDKAAPGEGVLVRAELVKYEVDDVVGDVVQRHVGVGEAWESMQNAVSFPGPPNQTPPPLTPLELPVFYHSPWLWELDLNSSRRLRRSRLAGGRSLRATARRLGEAGRTPRRVRGEHSRENFECRRDDRCDRKTRTNRWKLGGRRPPFRPQRRVKPAPQVSHSP